MQGQLHSQPTRGRPPQVQFLKSVFYACLCEQVILVPAADSMFEGYSTDSKTVIGITYNDLCKTTKAGDTVLLAGAWITQIIAGHVLSQGLGLPIISVNMQ